MCTFEKKDQVDYLFDTGSQERLIVLQLEKTGSEPVFPVRLGCTCQHYRGAVSLVFQSSGS